MSLYKRNNHWWVRFTTPGGERVRRSTGTADKRKAQEFHDRFKTEIWNVQKLGEKPKRIWEEAVIRWLKEKAHKASIKADRMHLRWLDQYLRGHELSSINRDLVDRLIKAKQAVGVSHATVNRMLQVLRAVLRMAEREWEWIDKAPVIRLLPEPKRRVRWLTRDEADRLLSELPGHLSEMARFSLATGLRQRNVADLDWSQVDLGKRFAWIHPDQAKARKAIAVPLNAEAILVLRRLHWPGTLENPEPTFQLFFSHATKDRADQLSVSDDTFEGRLSAIPGQDIFDPLRFMQIEIILRAF